MSSSAPRLRWVATSSCSTPRRIARILGLGRDGPRTSHERTASLRTELMAQPWSGLRPSCRRRGWRRCGPIRGWRTWRAMIRCSSTTRAFRPGSIGSLLARTPIWTSTERTTSASTWTWPSSTRGSTSSIRTSTSRVASTAPCRAGADRRGAETTTVPRPKARAATTTTTTARTWRERSAPSTTGSASSASRPARASGP